MNNCTKPLKRKGKKAISLSLFIFSSKFVADHAIISKYRWLYPVLLVRIELFAIIFADLCFDPKATRIFNMTLQKIYGGKILRDIFNGKVQSLLAVLTAAVLKIRPQWEFCYCCETLRCKSLSLPVDISKESARYFLIPRNTR